MAGARPLVLTGVAVAAAMLAVAPAAARASKLAPLTPAPADGLSRALASGEIAEARYALDRARALFRPKIVGARYGSVKKLPPEAATFVLRDLAARLDGLSPRDRTAAERLLARPSDGPADGYGDGWTTTAAPQSPRCEVGGSPRYCVHWVETTEDRPPEAGASDDGIPDWIDGTMASLAKVYDKQVGDLGFPAPKDDSSTIKPTGNPNGALDVYLADIGDAGLYGYCASDDPNAFDPSYEGYDVSAYCVLDNDFKPEQFPFGASGMRANRVTIAHEVHHAEQFALDFLEDVWIMESGATAMEHVVYPRIRDNYQYLYSSQVSEPRVPLDLSAPSSGSVYGNWIYLRFLSERLGGPKIMRAIWRRLDGRAGRPDDYSTKGIRHVLARRGTGFRKTYARFALANRTPYASYDLSGLPGGLRAPPAKRHWLGRGVRSREKVPRLDHQTSRTVVFRRRSDAPRSAKVALRLDLPRKSQGAAAKAIVVKRSGARDVRSFSLGSEGRDRKVLPFGRRVQKVELLLVNGSSRFRACWRTGSSYSCSGQPRDDGRPFSYRATIR